MPDATRPWQHVIEPLYGYILLAEAYVKKSGQFAKAWNFGPSTKQNMKVIDLVNLIKKQMQTNSRILIKRQFKKINKKYTSFESKYLNIDSSNVFKALKGVHH